jgi:CheY-like chemotaxis protein
MTIRVPCKVLVVDDDADCADSTAKLLCLWGYDARAAYSAAEAISLAPAFAPDIVLMDIAMPRTDGFEAARRISERCPDTKVVGITGFSREDVADRAEEAGFVGVLSKASTAAEIKAIIDTQCSASRG